MSQPRASHIHERSHAARLGLIGHSGFAREALLKALSLESDMIPVDLGSGGPESVHRAKIADPDLVLMDIAPEDAVTLSEALLESVPGTRPVVVHRGLDHEQLVRLAEAGCVGFVPTEYGYRDLLRELRGVIAQDSNCSPELAGALIRSLRKRPPDRGDRNDYLSALSPRERQVAALLERHCSNKEIASELGIEFGTVKNHVHNILTKLRLHNRWELPHLRGAASIADARSRDP